MDCYDSVDCIGECGEECSVWIQQKLDRVNSLIPKISDYDCDGQTCYYVKVPVDDEVKEVFEEFGYKGEKFTREIEDGEIDLNLIGFIYGKWFDGEQGYLAYEP